MALVLISHSCITIVVSMGSQSIVRIFLVIIFCEHLFWYSLAVEGTQLKAAAMPAPSHKIEKSLKTKPHKQKPKAQKVATLPGGKRELFPSYRLAAIYGTPNDPALGVLGEQPVIESVARAKQLAADYQPFSKEKVLPCFEIITTVASAEPTENNDYSRDVDPVVLKEWIMTAQKNGVYVVLDLQPGRSDFMTQALTYAELLKQPNVGLALDPEWRLAPNQVPLEQIGTVDVSEINKVSAWLSELTAKNKLPQKLFLIHQFRLDMITNRAALDTTHKNLAYVIQMDGNGDQGQKQDTWNYITADAPLNTSFAWKNFYDEDTPTLSPQETMQKVPTPRLVSYQ